MHERYDALIYASVSCVLVLVSCIVLCVFPSIAERKTEYLGYRWKWSPESRPGKALAVQRQAEEGSESEEDESEASESEEDQGDVDTDEDEDDAIDPIFAASLAVGTLLQAKDDDTQIWYEASVVDTRTNVETGQEEVKVHFRGFGAKFDLWYARNSRKLRPSLLKLKPRKRRPGLDRRKPVKQPTNQNNQPKRAWTGKREWSDREVAALVDLVRRDGIGDWELKAKQIGSERTPSAVLGKFKNLQQSVPELQTMQDEHDAIRQQQIWQQQAEREGEGEGEEEEEEEEEDEGQDSSNLQQKPDTNATMERRKEHNHGEGRTPTRTPQDMVEQDVGAGTMSKAKRQKTSVSSVNAPNITPCIVACQLSWSSRRQQLEPSNSITDEDVYRQFVAKLVKQYGSLHLDTITAQMNLAILLKSQAAGRSGTNHLKTFAEARSILRQVLRVRGYRLGDSHADTLIAKVHLTFRPERPHA